MKESLSVVFIAHGQSGRVARPSPQICFTVLFFSTFEAICVLLFSFQEAEEFARLNGKFSLSVCSLSPLQSVFSVKFDMGE